MRSRLVAAAAAGLVALGGTAACTDDADQAKRAAGGPGEGKVGVILPDTTTSQRWGSDDPKLLKAAFQAADVPVDIQNAQGKVENFTRIADSMIAGGARVLMIVSLDAVSGKAVLDKARAAGVQTIDYDRLTLNGAPTDNNATLFRAGYDSVLQPRYDTGAYLKGPEQPVPRWNNVEARFIFEQMFNQSEGEIDGVLAANDGLGNAAITILKRERINGTIPVTGQDAETQGLQNILAGDQCMTVYKPIKKEADAAAKLAISLYKGEDVQTNERVKDPVSGGHVKAVLLQPTAIFKKDIGVVIKDGFVDRKTICTGRFARLCKQNGIK